MGTKWHYLGIAVLVIGSIASVVAGCHVTKYQEYKLENPFDKPGSDDADSMRTEPQHDK